MFSKFYQGELTFLRQMGQQFAQVNPAMAAFLAERSTDPDVERLLEGFAFLTARIRERLEEEFPEVIQGLTEILLPHYLRPLPASSVVEFTPVPGALRARLPVPAGAEVASIPIDGTSCRFRTTAPFDLVPVSVQEVALDSAIGANPVLRVRLQCLPQALPAVFHPSGIRFFLHGELPQASTLLLWFAEHVREVTVRGLASGRAVTLPVNCVHLPGFTDELTLLPWPKLAPKGYRTIQELFTLPQKFLFVEVRDLHLAASVAEERFEIAFRTERPPELPSRPSKDSLRPNCSPVINLFQAPSDPVSALELAEEHLLRVSDLPREHAEVYELGAISALPEAGGARIPVTPFYAFSHAASSSGLYVRTRRSRSPIDGGVDTWVALLRPIDAGPGPGAMVLSLDVTATNRGLPGRLRLGDINAATQTSPAVARFKNITAVSPPGRPPLGTELHWRLLAHLSANRTSLASAEVLRALIDLYNFQVMSNEQVGRANRLRIEGIREVVAEPARRLLGGAPVRGTRMSVELDEASFAGPGDAWMFTKALDELLGSQVTVNSFSEVVATLTPSQRRIACTPRSGSKAIL